MSVQAILLPVFAQVTLTFFLMFWMARTRFAAVREKKVTVKQLEDDWSNWPERPAQIASAYHNQLQLPILFYVVVLIAMITNQADMIFVVLSWFFVVLRLAHAYIHTGSNNIMTRFRAFATGALVLTIMWLYILLKLFVGL